MDVFDWLTKEEWLAILRIGVGLSMRTQWLAEHVLIWTPQLRPLTHTVW
jgi:hypothetical protein